MLFRSGTTSHGGARTRLHMAEQYTEPPHRRKEVHGRVDDDRRALPTTHHRTPSDEQHTAQAVHHRARRKARRRARRRAQVTARCRAEDMARHMGLARRSKNMAPVSVRPKPWCPAGGEVRNRIEFKVNTPGLGIRVQLGTYRKTNGSPRDGWLRGLLRSHCSPWAGFRHSRASPCERS